MIGADPTLALLRAMARSGPGFTVAAADSRRWASATFAGDRHAVVLEAADTPELAAWLATLAEAEWTLPGLLVADLAVVSTARADGRTRITIEALTLDRDG